MTTVRNLLQVKGTEVWSVSPNASVLETLKLMAKKDVGALMVLDGEQIAGIISERDFVRSIAKTEKCLVEKTVKDYMTQGVYWINIDASLDDCMQLMTQERIRHLPVLENNKLVGLISIGDVVKATISNKESTISSLENYIEGRGYGQ